MVKLEYKLKAATLIESLIAMIIIVVCLGIATVIYSNVLNSDRERVQLKAMLLLKQEAEQTKKEKSFLDSEKKEGDWTVKKEVTRYEQTENIYRLSFKIINSEGKIIAVRNELIQVN